MTRSMVHRFPKWLLQEKFKMDYNPALRSPFRVGLEGADGYVFHGHGVSIVEAAKQSRQAKDKWK